MDPNKNLEQLLDCASFFVDNEGYPDIAYVVENAERLANLALDLDKWLRKGGSLPVAWLRDE